VLSGVAGKGINLFSAKEKNYKQFVGTKLPLSKLLTYFPFIFHVKSAKFRRDKNLQLHF